MDLDSYRAALPPSLVEVWPGKRRQWASYSSGSHGGAVCSVMSNGNIYGIIICWKLYRTHKYYTQEVHIWCTLRLSASFATIYATAAGGVGAAATATAATSAAASTLDTALNKFIIEFVITKQTGNSHIYVLWCFPLLCYVGCDATAAAAGRHRHTRPSLLSTFPSDGALLLLFSASSPWLCTQFVFLCVQWNGCQMSLKECSSSCNWKEGGSGDEDNVLLETA